MNTRGCLGHWPGASPRALICPRGVSEIDFDLHPPSLSIFICITGLLIVGGIIGAGLLITLGIAKSPNELSARQQGAGSLKEIAAQLS